MHDLFGVLVLSGNNKFTHVLVPRHDLLSKEESDRILKELGVKSWQLPRIAQDDPAIRDLSPEVGQIIRVTRKSDLVGEYVVYRLVVPSFSVKASTKQKKPEEEESTQLGGESTKKRVAKKAGKRSGGSTSKGKRPSGKPKAKQSK